MDIIRGYPVGCETAKPNVRRLCLCDSMWSYSAPEDCGRQSPSASALGFNAASNSAAVPHQTPPCKENHSASLRSNRSTGLNITGGCGWAAVKTWGSSSLMVITEDFPHSIIINLTYHGA